YCPRCSLGITFVSQAGLGLAATAGRPEPATIRTAGPLFGAALFPWSAAISGRKHGAAARPLWFGHLRRWPVCLPRLLDVPQRQTGTAFRDRQADDVGHVLH